MDCSTIIVSYNTFELTEVAVRSALQAAGGLRHEVVVVDNASPDGSAERLRRAFPAADFPHVHVIANVENRGFAAANNQGAREATGAVLFFLNSDTVVHGESVRILHDFLQAHPEAGAAGPHVFNTDGSDQSSTFLFPSPVRLVKYHLPLDLLLRGHMKRQYPVPASTTPTEIVGGAALAIRRDVFDEVGGWDEAYFMYSEETELCYSLVKAGYTNFFVRKAEITHHGGASSQDRREALMILHQQNALRFLKRHYSPGVWLLNRVVGTLGFGLRSLIFSIFQRLYSEQAEDFRCRRNVAATLFRWYVLEYR